MLTPTAARRSSAPLLTKSVYGSNHRTVKGEDGLRVERVRIGGEQVVMAIVVDGHRGHEAAAHVVDGLVELVAEEAHGDATGAALCSAACRAFEELHRQLHNSPNPTNAGTTVTLCLLNEVRAELSVCNVGDSSAYLFAKPGSNGSKSPSIELTQSHRLETSESERARVRSMGGVVGQSMVGKTPVGPMRGYPGGVCCSRSLGDRDCGSWLSPVPFTAVYPFPPAEAVLVVASDGVWDTVNPGTVSKLVLSANGPQNAARRVVARAVKAHGEYLRDDITCVCILGANISDDTATPASGSTGSFQNGSPKVANGSPKVAPRHKNGSPKKRSPKKSFPGGFLRRMLSPSKVPEEVDSPMPIKRAETVPFSPDMFEPHAGYGNGPGMDDSGHKIPELDDSVHGSDYDDSVHGGAHTTIFSFVADDERMQLSPDGKREVRQHRGV